MEKPRRQKDTREEDRVIENRRVECARGPLKGGRGSRSVGTLAEG